MSCGRSARREEDRATRIRARDEIGCGSRDRVQLPRPDRARELGFEHRVRPAGAATEAFVVELDELGDKGREQDSRRLVDALDVAQVARILDGDTSDERRDRRKVADPRCQPLPMS